MPSGPHYGAYIVVFTFFLATLYFYVRLVWALKLSRRACWILALVLLLLFLSFPVGKALGRFDSNALVYSLIFPSSIWLGFTFLFATCGGMYDLFRLLWKRTSSGRNSPFAQRLSFGPILLTSMIGFVIFLGGCALREAQHMGVTRVEIPLRNLPPELDGIRILQVSDVHYGMLSENGQLLRMVEILNDLHPDIVVFTGDLVDGKISHMEEMAGPLSRLRPRLGVYAVLGNHEYYAGADRMAKILKEANIHLLRNEIKVLPGGLQILGIDDPVGYRRMKEPRPDLEGLVSGLDTGKPSVLLYHRPEGFEKASKGKVGLQLSGHTHGAQMLPIRPLAEILFPYVRGLHQEGGSYLYVSRGVGTGGPPMRLGSPPEIVHIKLVRRAPAEEG